MEDISIAQTISKHGLVDAQQLADEGCNLNIILVGEEFQL